MRFSVDWESFIAIAMTRLWALILALTLVMPMFIPLQPAIAQPVLPAVTMATPAIFWHSKADVSGDQQVLSAYQSQLSNVIVENVVGVVEHVLPDDLEESRHQRFIVRLAGGHTVLIVHNIDIASRLPGLQEGDRVSIKGEYEWNERGGLIHWTHRDPRSVHEDGWIDYKTVRYE